MAYSGPIPMAAAEQTSARKVAMASMIGTTIEYYDFFLYGTAAALVFGSQFFPGLSPAIGLLASFAAFAVGFLARPIGGVVFGHFGDRIGRKKLLVITLIIMGSASTLIGVLPTYETIGIWAPILLVLLRLLQGIGLGGETGGAVLMSVEHAPEGSKNRFAGFTQMGTPAGLFLANAAFLITTAFVSLEGFQEWAWRIPFLFSAVLVAVGLYVRVSISESPSFTAAKESNGLAKLPFVDAVKGFWKPMLLVIFLAAANAIVAYIYLVFSLSYADTTLGISRGFLLALVTTGSLIWLVTIPFWTKYADRNGRRGVFIVGSLALLVAAGVFFPLLNFDTMITTILAYTILAFIVPITHSLQGVIIADVFPVEIRYSGFGLVLGGATVLAGISPLIASALWTGTGTTLSITIYLVVICAISTLCALALFRTVPDMDGGHEDQLTAEPLATTATEG